MFRPKAVEFTSKEAFNRVSASSQTQTGQNRTPRSVDPVNYPVFETPVNKKILVYVPNHTEMTELGEQLRCDRGAFHSIKSGRSYLTIRCTNGVVEDSVGYDGSCPVCDSINECWDLYNYELKEQARMKGVSVDDDPNELLKQTKRDLASNMALKRAEVWLTFPIVVVETKEGKLEPKVNEKGLLDGKLQWYSIRESTYKDKWESAFDTMDKNHPAGSWFILNFAYESPSGKHDKMNSARNLKVSYKPMTGYEQWEKYWDDLSEDWDRFKASSTVIANFYLSLDDMRQAVNEAMAPTRTKIQMYQATEGIPTVPVAGIPGNPQAALNAFAQGTPAPNPATVNAPEATTVGVAETQTPPPQASTPQGFPQAPIGAPQAPIGAPQSTPQGVPQAPIGVPTQV